MVFLLTSALLFTALAVDTGRLVMEKRRLQRIADLSALAAVDVAACSGMVRPDPAAVTAAAQTTALSNGYSGNLGAEAGAVTLGSTKTAKDGVRSFSSTATSDNSAVRVVATSTYPSSLILPNLLGGNTQLQATAVATKQLLTGIQLGSFLTRLNTGQSILNGLLGGLLGTNVSLGILDYKGIAAAQVTLLNLVQANANVGTVDELLKANVSVGDFLDILATAVDQNSTAQIALNQLSLTVGSLPDIKLGDILQVSGSNPEAALDAKVNVFDLLIAGLQLANKQHAISVPNVGVNLGQIAQVSLSLYVIEPPKIAIGPPGKDGNGDWWTETETAQLRLQLDVKALDFNIPLLLKTEVNLNLYLDAAKAHAYVKSVQCATANDRTHHVTVGVQPSVLSLGIGQYANISNGGLQQTPPTLLVEVLGIPNVLRLDLSATTAVQNPAAADVTFDVTSLPIPNPPPPNLTTTVGTNLGAALANAIGTLASTLDLKVNILNNFLGLGALLSSLLSAIFSLVLPLLQGLLGLIGSALLDPLLTALGLQFGGADVSLIWLEVKPTLLAI